MTVINGLLWCFLTYWVFGNFLTFAVITSGDNGFLGIVIDIPEGISLKDRIFSLAECAIEMPAIMIWSILEDFRN